MSEASNYSKRVVLNAVTISSYVTIHIFALLRINALENGGSLLGDALVVGMYLYGNYMVIKGMPFYARSRNWTIDKAVAITVSLQPLYATGVLALLIYTANGERAILVSMISVVGLYWLVRFLKAYG